jgi:hypothetical protein
VLSKSCILADLPHASGPPIFLSRSTLTASWLFHKFIPWHALRKSERLSSLPAKMMPDAHLLQGARREQKKTKKELALRHSVIVNYITDGRWHRSHAFCAATNLTSQRQNLEENET